MAKRKPAPVSKPAVAPAPAFRVSPLARTLDRLAEAHGVAAHHLPLLPAVLEEAGLEPADLSTEVITEAGGIHRRAMHAMEEKYGIKIH